MFFAYKLLWRMRDSAKVHLFIAKKRMELTKNGISNSQNHNRYAGLSLLAYLKKEENEYELLFAMAASIGPYKKPSPEVRLERAARGLVPRPAAVCA